MGSTRRSCARGRGRPRCDLGRSRAHLARISRDLGHISDLSWPYLGRILGVSGLYLGCISQVLRSLLAMVLVIMFVRLSEVHNNNSSNNNNDNNNNNNDNDNNNNNNKNNNTTTPRRTSLQQQTMSAALPRVRCSHSSSRWAC